MKLDVHVQPLKALYSASFGALVVATVAFPSGSVFGFPYKYVLAFVVAVTLLVMLFMGVIRLRRVTLAAWLALGVCIGASTGIGLIDGNGAYAFIEATAILSPLVILAMYRRQLMAPKVLLGSILGGAVLYAAMKLVLALAILSGHTSYSTIKTTIVQAFGYTTMSFPISGRLLRIYAVNDVIVSLMPVLLLGHHRLRIPRVMRWFVFVLFGISTLLSYSRYTFGLFAMSSVVALVPRSGVRAGIKKLDFVLGLSLVLVSICLLLLPVAPIRSGIGLLVRRVNPQVSFNRGSDRIRSRQFGHIVARFEQRPLFGWGIGASIPDYVRSTDRPYVYELQLPSFFFKFGLVGMLVGLVATGALLRTSVRVTWRSLLLLFTLLASSVVDPYIESSVFGVAVLGVLVLYSQVEASASFQELYGPSEPAR